MHFPRLRFRHIFYSVITGSVMLWLLKYDLHSSFKSMINELAHAAGSQNLTLREPVVPGHVQHLEVATPPQMEQSKNLSWCPDVPKKVDDPHVELNLTEITYSGLVKEVGDVMRKGGHYSPPECRSREHLAVIIPYRDRERNLHILLHNLLPFLWRQLVQFTVFLVEQTADHPFNKGLLFNAAFKESLKIANFTCFIMQDVDLIPMDNRNFYRCGEQPRHLAQNVGRTAWKNKLMYPTAFGGAIALKKKHIEKANGFSVSMAGALRTTICTVGQNKLRSSIIHRRKKEGLNSMSYTLVRHEKKKLYTWLLIKVPPPPVNLYGTESLSNSKNK